MGEMTEPRVLLVDDEIEFAQVLRERLEARGLHVETAASGEEALRVTAAKSFDAILLDLAMPGMDGIETLKRLRASNPDLQIILLTGNATVGLSVEAMKLGAVDVVEKPADLKLVLSKIDAASARKGALAQQRLDEQLTDILRRRGW